MREVDGLDDGCVRHCYLTRNSDETRVGMAQTCSFTFERLDDLPPQRLKALRPVVSAGC